jgi:nucleotide-binding universal stress UspA family protein
VTSPPPPPIERSVMVALDGSDKDGRAIAVATAVAKLSGRPLHFVEVLPDPAHVARASAAGLLYDAAADRAAAIGRLETAVNTADVASDRTSSMVVLVAKDVADALIEHAAGQDALVVVMATRAPGGVSRALLGSMADKVTRESRRPVVLVPPGATFLAGKVASIARVLVPLDDSSLSFRALELLSELPGATALSYMLVEVVDEEWKRATAEARLEASAGWLRSRGARAVDTLVVHAPDTAEAIVRTVRDALPQMIAMSTRGAGGLGRLVLGSVAQGVLRASELPVFLLTPRVLAGA